MQYSASHVATTVLSASICHKIASEQSRSSLISRNFRWELVLHAYVHTHHNRHHVTPLLKILATGLQNNLMQVFKYTI